MLEGMGYKNVKTYIQSGNVILHSTSNPSKKIASAVDSMFGFKPLILALSKQKFEKIIDANPYSSFEGKAVHFYFCANPPNPDNEKLASLAANNETYQLRGDVFYLHAPNGISRSRLVSNIESCLGVPATGRNLNTVLKLKEMINT